MPVGFPPWRRLRTATAGADEGGACTGAGWRAATAVFVAALFLLSGCGSVKAPGPNVGTQLDGAVPKDIMNLPLKDTTGTVRHLSDFAGRVLVISDGMTLCQETCPLDTATVVQTARRIDAAGLGGKVQFLTITVDPVRDTVPQIAAYRNLYAGSGGPGNWMVLTGSASDVHRLWKYFGVYTQKVPQAGPAVKNWRTGKTLRYDVEHSDEVFFLDGKGRERFVLEGMPVVQNKSDIPQVIYHFLSKHGRQNVGHAKPTDWTERQALQVLSWLLNKQIRSSA